MTFPPRGLWFSFCENVQHIAFIDLCNLGAEALRCTVMIPQSHGIRATKFHVLPTTSVIVALWDGEIIATASIIQDSELHLPADSIFDLSGLRQRTRGLVEVSALAIDKAFRGRREILFP